MSVSLGIVFFHGSILSLPQVLNLITVSATAAASALLKSVSVHSSEFPSHIQAQLRGTLRLCLLLLSPAN